MKNQVSILVENALNQKLKTLTGVGEDKDWNIYYVDLNRSNWCKSYPNSGLHGGGSPELYRIKKFPWETTE